MSVSYFMQWQTNGTGASRLGLFQGLLTCRWSPAPRLHSTVSLLALLQVNATCLTAGYFVFTFTGSTGYANL